MNDRFVCIHGHFYQPPREDPWTGRVEKQDSAAPYHDWNRRITAECYGPNTAARILDPGARIEEIVDNFSRISFDAGPTLLSWLEESAPRVYRAILEADKKSARRFSGHGSAIAQAYHHTILPLSSARDRRTEVLWGRRDFQRRFGRSPEGMWLPETAVDVATLEELAAAGIRFTILAPHQAARVRKAGDREWTSVAAGAVDTRRPYAVALPSGRRITVFFYDGPASRAIAFERLLDSAEAFAARLTEGGPGLTHVATDGESYGHHHPHGDMALAAALRSIESSDAVRLTNYGEFLDTHPAADEAEIAEDTSWSCEHGVERWRSDCGCRLTPGTSQAWRGPLRSAFDRLRQAIDPCYSDAARSLFTDPWRTRDEAVDLFDAAPEAETAFLAAHGVRPLRGGEHRRAIELLDMQRHLLRVSTSCGWFFDDVAGIEARQVISYAARAVELAERLLGPGFEEPFRGSLSEARGNSAALPDARAVYDDIRERRSFLVGRAEESIGAPEAFEEALLGVAEAVEREPGNREALSAWVRLVEIAPALPFSVSFWAVQNVYGRMRKSAAAARRGIAAAGDQSAEAWISDFDRLGEILSFAPDPHTLAGGKGVD